MDDEKTPRGSSFGSAVHEEQKIDDPLLTEESHPTSLPKDNDKDRTNITGNTVESPGPIDTDIDPIAAAIDTPLLTVSPPKTPTPVSGDILLPLIIFSVVKANPPQLVSHLLYTQRFRNQSFGGEESYCLVNLMAVVEFLENVDLGALGLKESEKKVTRFVQSVDTEAIRLTDFDPQQYCRLDAHPLNSSCAF